MSFACATRSVSYKAANPHIGELQKQLQADDFLIVKCTILACLIHLLVAWLFACARSFEIPARRVEVNSIVIELQGPLSVSKESESRTANPEGEKLAAAPRTEVPDHVGASLRPATLAGGSSRKPPHLEIAHDSTPALPAAAKEESLSSTPALSAAAREESLSSLPALHFQNNENGFAPAFSLISTTGSKFNSVRVSDERVAGASLPDRTLTRTDHDKFYDWQQAVESYWFATHPGTLEIRPEFERLLKIPDNFGRRSSVRNGNKPEVYLSFLPNGQLAEAALSKTSGNPELDKSALQLFRTIENPEPLPPSFSKDGLRLLYGFQNLSIGCMGAYAAPPQTGRYLPPRPATDYSAFLAGLTGKLKEKLNTCEANPQSLNFSFRIYRGGCISGLKLGPELSANALETEAAIKSCFPLSNTFPHTEDYYLDLQFSGDASELVCHLRNAEGAMRFNYFADR
jgi:hypothetical protein